MIKINSLRKIFLLSLMIANFSFPQDIIESQTDTLKEIAPQNYYKEELLYLNTVLTRYHYKKFVLNDSLSSLIFERYLKSLDPSRLYFISSDIKKFDKFRYKIDDYLLDGNLNLAYEVFNFYRNRVTERINHVSKLLKNEFDFSVD